MVHQGHTTVGYLRMQMVVAHGGRCAERILNGDNVSDGGQDDLQKISAVRIFIFFYIFDVFLHFPFVEVEGSCCEGWCYV